jgi:hypothetical protein
MPTVPTIEPEGEDNRSLLNQIEPRKLQGPLPGTISLSYLGNLLSRKMFGDLFFPMERHIKSQQKKATEEAIEKMEALNGAH